MNQPTHPDFLLRIGTADLRIFSWRDLVESSEPVPYLDEQTVQQNNVLSVNLNRSVDMATKLLKNTKIVASETSSKRLSDGHSRLQVCLSTTELN